MMQTMMQKKRSRTSLWFFLLIAVIYSYTWYLQSTISLNCDVSWLMLAAKRLWLGGNYVDDFFETNPPLILYLYLTSYLIKYFLSVSIVNAIRLFIFGIISISLILCFLLLQKIFSENHKRLFYIFFTALTSSLFLIPISAFGQREHLAITLIMPYIFLVTLRVMHKSEICNNHQTFNPFLACFSGFMAGIGFSIKPFFYLTFLLIELYVHSWRTRLELITAVCTIAAYALSIYIFHHEYLSVIVPFSLRTYYQGNYDPTYALIKAPSFLFCLFSLFLFFIPYRHYKALTSLLAITLLGFLGSHFGQHILLFYHLLPAFICAFLLIVLSISCATLPLVKPVHFYLFTTTLAGLVFVYLYTNYYNFWTFTVMAPAYFFTYFFCIFMLSSYLFAYQKSTFIIFLSIATLIVISATFSYFLQFTDFFPHRFSSTLLMLFFLFALTLPSKLKIKAKVIFHSIFSTLALTFVFYFFYNSYNAILYADGIAKPFLNLLKSNPQYHSIYALADHYGFTFNAVNELNLRYASRFPFFWMASFLSTNISTNISTNNSYSDRSTLEKKNLQQVMDKNFFVDMVASDIQNRKPDVIFVDITNPKFKRHIFNYDYLADFLTHKSFRTAFMPYHYVTEMHVGSLYGSGFNFAFYAR